jgi:hypothetical protein
MKPKQFKYLQAQRQRKVTLNVNKVTICVSAEQVLSIQCVALHRRVADCHIVTIAAQHAMRC